MSSERSSQWRYSVCGMLLCASMLLYMDRLTLSQLATTICREYSLSNSQYGLLDSGFSIAFACGALFFGFLVDRIGPRWLYPFVVIGWSCSGVATSFAEPIGRWLLPDPSISVHAVIGASTVGLMGSPFGDGALASLSATYPGRLPISDQAYWGFFICRVALGFFESGHWPCALVTTQIILARSDRSLGNSILQSGAAIGSILTPHIVLRLTTPELGGWQPSFVVIGCIGMVWAIPWLLMIRRGELDRKPETTSPTNANTPTNEASRGEFWRMFGVLVVTVISINLTWQYFRNWLPKFLEETHHYSKDDIAWFISAYYIVADVGCLLVGVAVIRMVKLGWDVHRARLWTYTVCVAMTSCAVAVAFLPRGPWLWCVLMIVAGGSLGLFPNYYSFTQELSKSHQGRVSGSLGTLAWSGSAAMQYLVGKNIDETGAYTSGIIFAGLVPIVGCLGLWFLWPRRQADQPAT